MTAAGELPDAIKAAMSVAKDLAEGRVTVAQIGAEVAAEHRRMFGTVVGPDDPLWPVHVEVCRRVLALDGIPPDELAEWLAVTRAKLGVEAVAERSWIERALAEGADDEDES